jgi:hypothetical protein
MGQLVCCTASAVVPVVSRKREGVEVRSEEKERLCYT